MILKVDNSFFKVGVLLSPPNTDRTETLSVLSVTRPGDDGSDCMNKGSAHTLSHIAGRLAALPCKDHQSNLHIKLKNLKL